MQIRGFKKFQDSADWTRKKTQGGMQGAQRPSQWLKKTSGSQQPGRRRWPNTNEPFYFILLFLLFEFYLFI